MSLFSKATKTKTRLRMALLGGPGDGKTYSALRFAAALAKQIEATANRKAKIAAISTEFGAIEKYLGENPDDIPFEFDTCNLPNTAPTSYTHAIQQAAREGYDILIIDSLSHAWAGKDGALAMVDNAAKDPKKNQFTAWKDVTPMQNALIEAINQSPIHVIATMRLKMEFALEEYTNERGEKKSSPKRMGLAPVQRSGMEYEFDIVCEFDNAHLMKVTKSRCPAVDGQAIPKPGAAFIGPIWDWLQDGVDAPQPPAGSAVVPPPPATAEAGNARAVAAGEMGLRAATNGTGTNGHAPGPGESDPRNGPPAERPQSPIAAEPDPGSEITKEQLAEINRLCEALAVPPKVRDQTWMRYKVGSWRSLTYGQAAEIISKLRAFELGEQTPPWEAPARPFEPAAT